MNSIQFFTDLFHHMDWADSEMWRSVLDSPTVMSDQKIRERLVHIHQCQRAWLNIWLEQEIDPHAGESLDMLSLMSWAREYHQDVARFLLRMEDSQLDDRIKVPGVGEESAQPCLWETFVQIISHSTYHRGQVSAQIRDLGAKAPQTDFITWVTRGKPIAGWKPATPNAGETPALPSLK